MPALTSNQVFILILKSYYCLCKEIPSAFNIGPEKGGRVAVLVSRDLLFLGQLFWFTLAEDLAPKVDNVNEFHM